jgi:hypothetical protein
MVSSRSLLPRLGDCDDQIDDWVLDLGVGVDFNDALRQDLLNRA